MSTINAQNFGNGTDSVPASAVLEGTAKAYGCFDVTATSQKDYNVSSATDDATGQQSWSLTNAMSDTVYVTNVEGDDNITRTSVNAVAFEDRISTNRTVSSFTGGMQSSNGSDVDPFTYWLFGVWGDLA